MEIIDCPVIALVLGFVLDQLFGDPVFLPHPIVGFGKTIAFLEKKFNNGRFRFVKGLFISIILVVATFVFTWFILFYATKLNLLIGALLSSVLIFYMLSARTLRKEVKSVFDKSEISLPEGRKQLARIVGRDTDNLSLQQVRTASLETLSENLSDGVVAPLFWFLLLGLPGMMAYKMVNTLDSMIGYKSERFLYFGKFAAKLDDFCNFVPARLTALLMLVSSSLLQKLKTVFRQAKNHTSPNSGYPEAALATVLNCQFGGDNYYQGKLVSKPLIGNNTKEITYQDLKIALAINMRTEWLMLLICVIILIINFLNK